MRYVIMEDAVEGMVLARTIYDSSTRVLLGTGTIIKQEYIDKLQQRGLSGIYVEDELSKGIQIEEVITEQLRNEGVGALREGSLDSAKNVAHKIVNQILDKPQITLELVDLRTFDDYTYRHSVNVAVIATVIGLNMEFNRYMLEDLCESALLHDIGKLLIDTSILNKPGKLTDEEYKIIKTHPELAYDILSERVDVSSRIRAGVLCHHENEDGSGYPKGLSGEEIYIYAKIIHVADVFDALTSKRPYKVPYTRAEAIEYLMGACDRMFDRHVVVAFIKSVAVYPKGCTVTLSTGQKGIIVSSVKNSLRPIVRLEDGSEVDLSDMDHYRNVTIIDDGSVK